MKNISILKVPIVVLGDVLVFYLALVATLVIRYSEVYISSEVLSAHLLPFSIALVIFLFFFFIDGFYEDYALKDVSYIRNRVLLINLICGGLFVLTLYFIPSFSITPKANLILFVIIFSLFIFSFRYVFNILLKYRFKISRIKILILGDSVGTDRICKNLDGGLTSYALGEQIKDISLVDFSSLAEYMKSNAFVFIVAPEDIASRFYSPELSRVHMITTSEFYEKLFKAISLHDINESWINMNIKREMISLGVTYFVERFLALVLFILLSPILLIISLLVYLTSPGPIIYKQRRVGQNGKVFWLYKFRSMYHDESINPDARANTATWAKDNDPRVTPLGRFIRKTHLDELPQLVNIIEGDMSFVGPRPERPEFVELLKMDVPFYSLRSLLKPGVTGWAQINYPYGSSVEDAFNKLQYDLYYLKNRGVFLNIYTILKTIKHLI
ncbi:MAG: hypothetical protein COU06_01625 [Candidatus Harrisonbacteria bacterium CG10_big_fil_rev_8_21_14_0_10_38_8]|uniref:Bacterial sugar transferase domain-containing protein n=1 Tax=Candidatus Harrisonbacteria bacterium CG10_big_fil_rev_8_21_14_0_10_38_8 TaxID=1974582 RepID=A0A2M6WJW2_9BACT|nr:MAG: hypothetical protein COU06_01625 [Candidatus Harrisonbacteria bacterium CG10_big_fil_rev_8_21_14_0_10_38_8]